MIYAGQLAVLALEARAGRFPAKFVNASPLFWVCQDGQVEHPCLVGKRAQEDIAHLLAELESGGLVVAELPEMAGTLPTGRDEATHWLLTPGAQPVEASMDADAGASTVLYRPRHS